MFNSLAAQSVGMLVLLISSEVQGQIATPPASQPTAQGLGKLTGDDAKREQELDKAIAAALEADRWDEAIGRAEELLRLRSNVLGPGHFRSVNAEWLLKALRRVARMPKEDRAAFQSADPMTKQAQALESQGKFGAAQPLLEKVLAIRRRLLTDDDPRTAQSYGNLASNLDSQGKYATAQPLYEKALEITRRILGDDHPDTANGYNNLAFILDAQGKYAAAQPLYEKALGINRRLLGDDHPDIATNYDNLATNLASQGRNAQAQRLAEKGLEIRRRKLGDDHPLTGNSYHNLAFKLYVQGKLAQAQPLLEKALEISRRVLGEDNLDTAITYGLLASNLDAQGKYVVAQPLHEKALEIHRRLLTDDHPHTARSYNGLAVNLSYQRKYAQVEPLVRKALEIRRRLLGEDHPSTALGYNNVAQNLKDQRKYAEAQPLFEKALASFRRLLTDENPATVQCYNRLALNLDVQGKYAEAQQFHEKGLEISRRLLTEDHPHTAQSYINLGSNLDAQGKYREAKDRWLAAVKSQDAARLQSAFAGLERAGNRESARPTLAAVLARLGQPAEAWQTLEQDLGRGLLDELAARQDRRIAPGDRARLGELVAALERLDRLVETTPKGLDQAERAQRFDDLKRRRELASIALGEFQTRLVQAYGPLAGQTAKLDEIQAALPVDAVLVAWVDIPPVGPNAADPDGEHWAVVIRSRGIPVWVAIAGTGRDGTWTNDDSALAGRVRTELRNRPVSGRVDLRSLLDRLRTQRLDPLANAMAANSPGLPPVRRLIVLPSPALAGVPIEALLAPDDGRMVTYAPSATVWKYLREQPRPLPNAGLLALGDPVFEKPERTNESKPLPDQGLLIQVVLPGSNAATRGLKSGDVLLTYNGQALKKREDLKAVPEPGQPVPVEIWRDGQVVRRDLAPGKLGVVLDPRPAREAVADSRRLKQVLLAARSGIEEFVPLPGTRYEVEALTRLFQSADRWTRTLLETDASEPELDRLAASGELRQYGFIHLATHGVIDEDVPARSAVILTQTGLPDPLEQALSNKPVFDGRLTVREIQHGWEMNADLVTLSACETALGRAAGGEGFVGFTQALLMSGARSVCLSLWKVDDTATALLMQRFYANLLGRRPGLSAPLAKAEALQEAKAWLRGLSRAQVLAATAALSGGIERGKGAARRKGAEITAADPHGSDNDRPYSSPHFWAAFVLAGD